VIVVIEALVKKDFNFFVCQDTELRVDLNVGFVSNQPVHLDHVLPLIRTLVLRDASLGEDYLKPLCSASFSVVLGLVDLFWVEKPMDIDRCMEVSNCCPRQLPHRNDYTTDINRFRL